MNILVTGGSSMIGRQLVEQLTNEDVKNRHVFDPSHNCLNLETEPVEGIQRYIVSHNISSIYHLAGFNGGIEFNRLHPADIYYKTTMMALKIMRAAGETGVKTITSVLASCSYPDCVSSEPLREENLWSGSPNQTVECHGLAKRNIHAFGKQVEKQYGTKSICCILTNSYGPHDSYDPIKTKVVGALIKKFVDAKNNNAESVTCWGDGSPLREFIYCADAAKGIILSSKNDYRLINVGVENECSIKELTNIVANCVGYTGEILWDTTKANGQMRKKLDTTKITSLGFKPDYTLEQGIEKTVQWYKETISA